MGKPWALRCGVQAAVGEWIVTLDADTRPDAQLPLALVARAIRDDLALASAGGRFRCRTGAGRWLHAAMLTTLVYRFGAGGTPGKRGVANGQCLSFTRSDAIDGAWFDVVAHDIVEDVALARHVHGAGKRVGFVDASRLLVVEMFDGFGDTWRGWGRSLALPGVEPMWRQILQVVVLGVVMVLAPVSIMLGAPSVVSIVIVAMRLGTLVGTRRAYERGGAGYWLSPLADPIAVLAVLGNVIVPRRVWRGRSTRQ
jgi:dolichol-phosphate mannosyltransferase